MDNGTFSRYVGMSAADLGGPLRALAVTSMHKPARQHAVFVTVAVQGQGHGSATQKVTLDVLGPDTGSASRNVTISC